LLSLLTQHVYHNARFNKRKVCRYVLTSKLPDKFIESFDIDLQARAWLQLV